MSHQSNVPTAADFERLIRSLPADQRAKVIAKLGQIVGKKGKK